jgi:tetratricopeptide (TPR) repeat protein
LLSGHEISNTEDIYFQARFSCVLSLLLWERIIAFPFGLLLLLALWGLAINVQWKRQSHLILFQIAYALSIILFFVIARYRLPLIPVLCLWAAAGISGIYRMIRQKQIKSFAIPLLAAGLLLLMFNRNPLTSEDVPGLDGNINLGNKYLELKQYDLALKSFREATELSPYSSRPYNGAATALIHLGRPQEAKEDLKQAILHEPSLIQAHNNLARILEQENDLAGAERHYSEVLRLDSTNAFAHQGLGDVALKKDDAPTAIIHYRRAYELGLADRQIISRWAAALLQDGRPTEALQVNTILLALEPNNARAHHNQARIYIACDSLEQAARELETVLRLSPDTKEAQEQLDEIRVMRQ